MRLVPLDTLLDVVHTFDPSADLMVYTHHGMRAPSWLRGRAIQDSPMREASAEGSTGGAGS